MFDNPLFWFRSWRLEAILRSLGGGVVDFDGRGLKSEGLSSNARLGLGFYKAGSGSGEAFFGCRGGVIGGWGEAGRFHVLGEGWGHGAEAGGVGCRLRAELGEIEVGTGAVTNVHRLAEALLGVVSIEDDGVEDDSNALEDNFDDATDKCPVLKFG